MAFYRQRGLRQLSSEVSSEGVGIGGGFIVGGVIGRKVEDIIKPGVTTGSSATDKLIAWAANNGAKAATYVLARKYDANTPITREATKALAGSIVYDTILRLANHGVSAEVRLADYRIMSQNNSNVQRLVQENSTLRTELNKALQRLASTPADIKNMPGYNPDMPGFRYAAIPDPYERQRRFGAMPANQPAVTTPAPATDAKIGSLPYGAMPFWGPSVQEKRERRYGFAAAPPEGSATAEMYGML